MLAMSTQTDLPVPPQPRRHPPRTIAVAVANGVTRPVTVAVQLQNGVLVIVGSAPVTFSDFGVTERQRYLVRS